MRHRRRSGTLHAGTSALGHRRFRRRRRQRAAGRTIGLRISNLALEQAGRSHTGDGEGGGKGRRRRPVGSTDRPRRRRPVGSADRRRRAWGCGPGSRCPPRSAARRNPRWRRRPRSAGRRGGERGRDRVAAARGPADGGPAAGRPPGTVLAHRSHSLRRGLVVLRAARHDDLSERRRRAPSVGQCLRRPPLRTLKPRARPTRRRWGARRASRNRRHAPSGSGRRPRCRDAAAGC
jgi:hypothetical protein